MSGEATTTDLLRNPDSRSAPGDRTNPFYTEELSKGPRARIAMIEDDIRDRLAFKGKYQTHLTPDRRLAIPFAYQPMLEFGGVITKGVDEHLMLFGRRHWDRFQRVIAREITGLNPDKSTVIRHIYSHAYEFEKVSKDGTITLTKELTKYANIKKNVTMVGVVYFAEVHANADARDTKLNKDELKKLANSIKWQN